MAKRVYLFDGISLHNNLTTNFNGFWDCQESPLEVGVYLTPVASTEIEPPAFDGLIQTCTWDGTQWVLADIPKPIPAVTNQLNSATTAQPISTGSQVF